jgi:hypothetical protein
MAEQIVVGTYATRREADEARARLVAEGVAEDRISIVEDTGRGAAPMPPQDRVATREIEQPKEPGFAGVVSRMFSGALMDDANVVEYSDALRNGRCLLVVRVESDERRRTASTILERGGPRVYALPNAPTGWNEAHLNDPASIGGVDDDPVRPEGLLTDVDGLPVDADEARLANAPRAPRNR